MVLLESFWSAVGLVLSGDTELYGVIARSLCVSLTAVCLAGLVGIPAGIMLGLGDFKGRNTVLKLVYVCMGLPPVLVGLLVFLLLSRSGPVAPVIYILFTPQAMILAQFILAVPIATGLTVHAVEERAALILLTARGLGASMRQALFTLVRELKIPLITAVATAFGRVIAEVGAVMLVGGDIEGYTRVLTTAIVLETRKGNFSLALALGIVLLALSFLINSLLYAWQYRRS
ncbi:MAG: ABC transporter permease [Peptococcaceae bacterium]|jgi:tungstate transport system permease protein|nr:ABC transporter permease [Peptococcaceae bacterium]MDH7524412.1 ABC transporter permease [Peptococcaceae bacterium]